MRMDKKLLAIIGLATVAAMAPAQRYYRDTYTLGESDRQPRLSDRNAVYVWHEGRTFYIALGADRLTNYGVRIDVLGGRISNPDRRHTGSRRTRDRDVFS